VNSMAWKDEIPAERLLGYYTCGLPGPLILAIGGIHGNEPNGPRAIKAFVNMLEAQQPLITGTFLGLMGNIRASNANQRYIDKDLNRCFVPGYVTAANADLLGHEAGELRQLAQILHRVKQDFEDVCFVDCHTTSAQTIPYISVNAHPPSIQLANRFPLNNVIGLQQSIPGCFTEYGNALDFRGFTFEAGQHQSAAAYSNQVAMLWLLLVYAGALSKHDLKTFRHYEKLLGVETPTHRRSFRLLSHYRIKDGEDFVMRPGFRNFDHVRAHAHLADNRYGPIFAPADGYVLMPLYQKQGNDGFFLLEEESNSHVLSQAVVESL
jgi:succinylglutamate desuccinylase